MKEVLRKVLPKNVLQILYRMLDYMKYFTSIIYLFLFKLTHKKYSIFEDEEAIKLILKEKKSIARYGDGEFKWMLGIKQNSFQDDDEVLKQRLLQIIKDNENKNILIGIPQAINSFSNYTYDAKLYWSIFLRKHIKVISKYLNFNKKYINTNITRPYIDYKNKSGSERRFNNLKRIWDNKEVIIIEGEKSKLGLGNDLFDNTKKVERIICPSRNAFSKYNEILEFVLKQDKEKLLFISLGPTATVLAYDLSLNGHQAIDIGHIDIEYEWFRKKTTEKVQIEGKFVNEAKNKSVVDIYGEDEKYLKSIIKRII